MHAFQVRSWLGRHTINAAKASARDLCHQNRPCSHRGSSPLSTPGCPSKSNLGSGFGFRVCHQVQGLGFLSKKPWYIASTLCSRFTWQHHDSQTDGQTDRLTDLIGVAQQAQLTHVSITTEDRQTDGRTSSAWPGRSSFSFLVRTSHT
jgi:hypothetical protein